jgi:hypothetical protein
MNQPQIRKITTTRDYSEYWEVHYLLIRVLRRLGVVLNSKGRLPLFRLWIKISTRMQGDRQKFILKIIQALVSLRIQGKEPPHNDRVYL